MPEIKVHRTHPKAKLPTKGHIDDQCIDFYAAEDVVIRAGETKLVDLGIKLVLPEGYGLEFRERSGLATKGILIGAGVIDEGYHGQLKAVVRYMTGPDHPATFEISQGDKIVQAELVKRIPITIRDVGPMTFEADAQGERGDRGFGSTDEANRIKDLEAWREKYQK